MNREASKIYSLEFCRKLSMSCAHLVDILIVKVWSCDRLNMLQIYFIMALAL